RRVLLDEIPKRRHAAHCPASTRLMAPPGPPRSGVASADHERPVRCWANAEGDAAGATVWTTTEIAVAHCELGGPPPRRARGPDHDGDRGGSFEVAGTAPVGRRGRRVTSVGVTRIVRSAALAAATAAVVAVSGCGFIAAGGKPIRK